MIGRFQVMCILQYLRFKRLGLEDEQAKSLALCRAIFYARAKYGFFPKAKTKTEFFKVAEEKWRKLKRKYGIHPENIDIKIIGGDRAYSAVLPNGKELFFIGEEIQDNEKWYKSVIRRFGEEIYKEVLKEAEEYIDSFDDSVLMNGQYFFNKVYKPVRDKFKDEWNKKIEERLFVENKNVV